MGFSDHYYVENNEGHDKVTEDIMKSFMMHDIEIEMIDDDNQKNVFFVKTDNIEKIKEALRDAVGVGFSSWDFDRKEDGHVMFKKGEEEEAQEVQDDQI